MYDVSEEPRSVSAERFPAGSPRSEQLKYLLNYAVLAPSVYNTQPWTFKVTDGEAAIFVDRARAMPITDPLGRNLVISCGAALYNLRIAISHVGYEPIVRTFPDLDVPNLLAFVRIGDRREATDEEHRLFEAVTVRSTTRGNFLDETIPADILKELQNAASEEGARLSVIEGLNRQRALTAAIREASERRMQDGPSRLEIEKWTHASSVESANGAGPPSSRSPEARKRRRSRRRGMDRPAPCHDGNALTPGDPPFFILETAYDNMAAWLAAGQALERALLTATSYGLRASFWSHAVGVDQLRDDVREIAGTDHFPQLILRIGKTPPGSDLRTRRVPVDIVSTDEIDSGAHGS